MEKSKMKPGLYWIKDGKEWDVCRICVGARGVYVQWIGDEVESTLENVLRKGMEFGPPLHPFDKEPYPPMMINPSVELNMKEVTGRDPLPESEIDRIRKEFEDAFTGPEARGRLYVAAPGSKVHYSSPPKESFMEEVEEKGKLIADWSPDSMLYEYEGKKYEIYYARKAVDYLEHKGGE
jgi:hypothetical protein